MRKVVEREALKHKRTFLVFVQGTSKSQFIQVLCLVEKPSVARELTELVASEGKVKHEDAACDLQLFTGVFFTVSQKEWPIEYEQVSVLEADKSMLTWLESKTRTSSFSLSFELEVPLFCCVLDDGNRVLKAFDRSCCIPIDKAADGFIVHDGLRGKERCHGKICFRGGSN